jgi:hypothetical protein
VAAGAVRDGMRQEEDYFFLVGGDF